MSPPVPAEVMQLNSQAVQAMASRQLGAARQLLLRALELDPKFLPGWMNLAATRRAEGDLAGAMAAVDAALKVDPMAFMALLMRASLFEAMGKRRKAANAYNIALGLTPSENKLDPATRRAVAHGLEFHARHAAELDSFLKQTLFADRVSGPSAEARRMRRRGPAQSAEADDGDPPPRQNRPPKLLPAPGTLVRHHLRHTVGEHQDGHDAELARLRSVGAAVVQQDGVRRQPVVRGKPVEAGIGHEQQFQMRGGAGELRFDHAGVADQRLGFGDRGGEVVIRRAHADHMSDLARSGRFCVPHGTGEVEKRVVRGVVQVDTHGTAGYHAGTRFDRAGGVRALRVAEARWGSGRAGRR